MKTATITTVVVDCTSEREGVTTLRISPRTSFRKSVVRVQNAVTWFVVVLFCGEPERSSPVANAVFAITLLPSCTLTTFWLFRGNPSMAAGCRLHHFPGRGARIRTEKFGFGDRQFNR